MSVADLLDILRSVSAGIANTVLLTVLGFAIGAVVAIPIALMRLSSNRLLTVIGGTYVEVIRGLPVLVWLLVIYYGLAEYVTLDPLTAAVIGLALVSAAHLAENYRSGVLSVAAGQTEAAAALGLTSRHTFWRVVAPQGFGVAVPSSATFAMALLKESAAASVVGVGDVAFWANVTNQQGRPALPTFIIAGAIYLLLSIPIAGGSRFADRYVRARTAVRS